ncbi:tetratricopeptide repeat protein [Actinoplanes friuliensis]|uniref:tetratricopeptide repeat protein n=1 Tax=Actinoplanes friuliensis TaxID=196914 RepID=UPI00130D4D1D|nr:tetratricopeptide repeat protein [Actinoplanes friuliensis]
MRKRWTRPALVITLAAATLVGAGVALGPLRKPPAETAAPVSPTRDLDAYVTRTSVHLADVPGDWQAWAQLGLAHVQLARITYDPGHYPAAEKALRRSLTVRPQRNAAALTGLGALAAARHNFREAAGFAERAVAADHYSADAYGVLTDAYVELGRYPEATRAVQRMLDLRPDTGSFGRASYLFELRGNLPKANELMRRALDVAVDPADITFALTHLAELAFNAGDLGTATGYLTEGLSRRPGEPALLADRAKVSAARGDLDAALTDLRAATATLPTVDHLVTLADTLEAAGRSRTATDDLVRVSTRLPGAGPSTTDIDLVLFHADRGEGAAAVAQGRALLAARPSVTVETAYAWALHSAGRDREARKHADRGLRLGTRDARAHYYRAMIRLELGDRAGARTDLTQALRINPHFSLRYAPKARAQLADLDGPA